ncbi:hypothetical protein J8L98_05035 [Pseudoalteromonas sp. MMG013]|uniref:hypothetical protein n=1 Tax=unclassified Pseudoalteromonas TaxID=194690 RepID=UPI001B38D49C|nr:MULTISPECIES: hypothetical protein [unclassified Pseudoalteromonas]MBQ4852270.1 hypothetical protein [Pseudoalteromonas sp. MMG012]MBQ4861062.1 hypothetical protein [Pseudoalteromonas sp. MMG013]
MGTKRIILSAASISVFVGAVFYYMGDVEHSELSKKNDNAVQSLITTNTAKLEQIGAKISDKIDSEKPLPKSGEVNTKERMLIAFERMQMSVGKFNSSAFMKAELQELLKDSNTVDIAKNTLLNLESAKQNFGEEQALARVYSIKLLEELANQGEPYQLYDTTVKLAEVLDQQALDNQEFLKRQDLDLEELVHASINTFEEAQVLDHPETVMTELGYSDEQHDRVRKIYANIFGSVFLRNSSIDESIARVQALFNKQGSSNG